MNRFKFNELTIGQSHTFQNVILEEHVSAFSKVSGDFNPLHMDASYARSRGYKDRVVFGMLVASLLSQLVGMYLPGENALLHEVQTSFLKPVFIGDILSVHGRITELHENFRQLELQVNIVNQDGVKVVRAKIKAGCHV